MAFTQKKLKAVIELANGQFEGGGNKHTAEGLRMSAEIVNNGQGSGNAQIAIYGMPLATMNQLSTVGPKAFAMYKNQITLYAGDEESGVSLIYSGDIYDCWVDAQAMPQVCLRISSQPGAFAANKPAEPLSIRGSADVAGMMSGIASKMGLGFENAGVTARLSNPYYGGTLFTQAIQIARDCNFTIGFDRGTMCIVAPGHSRSGDPVLISPDTGMVNYPMFQQSKLILTSLFNPAVKYQGLIKVESDLTPACGIWQVNNLVYQLESMMPHGKWFMTMQCVLQHSDAPA